MTKRSTCILPKVLVGAFAIAIGADATRGVRRELPTSLHSDEHLAFHELTVTPPKNWNDPELLEYFQADTTNEEQIPIPSPLFRVKESVLQNLKNHNNYRILSEDEVEETEEKEYSNYDKEEAREHDEKLITDDDASASDDWAAESMPISSLPTSSIAPTEFGTIFWEELDGYKSSPLDPQENTPTEEDQKFRNRIRLKLSLGVVNTNKLSENQHKIIVEMALSCITKILNDHSEIPFLVRDQIAKNYHNRRHLESDWLPKKGFFDDERSFLADLILEDADIVLGSHSWWEVTAIYSVWKRPSSFMFYREGDDEYEEDFEYEEDDEEDEHDRSLATAVDEQHQRRRLGMPVEQESILAKIEGICNHAIEEAVWNGVYWKALHEVDVMDETLVIENGLFFEDDKGLVDVALSGEEYNLASIFCPIERSEVESVMLCPIEPTMEGAAVEGDSLYDDTFPIPADLGATIIRDGTSEATYPRVIVDSLSEIEWGDREWVGLALMISTIVWTIILSLTAHFVFQKRKTRFLWGNALTPGGVDDFLKVGWRVYEQPQFLEAENPPQPQLFLQIYDKGKGPGYNDENSMLKGGVEPTLFAPN